MGDCGDVCIVGFCLLTVLIIIGGIVCLIVFLGVVPYQRMKFHVNDASLTEFYLTNDDILHYNLAVNISVRNSNKIERISYDKISSKTYCYGNDLALVSLTSFWQDTESTTLLHPVFQGQTSIKLRGSRLRDFNNDQRDGSYSIYVVLYLRIQIKHAGGGKSEHDYFKVKCGLMRLHLLGSSSDNQTRTGGLFQTRRCKLSYDESKYQSY
ncbi:hypothetical protein MKW94_030373 [Papaver nudicaule]|uniref:Late embryogenesis abundant protein LEA-2 subgroup domain-containing protein n=1 Tax=Papaver nudicaule TaxID=74823 RepID=A0AA41UZJ0_PAPNU|nr:hypothetical protein [Papaver nudicaule]